MYDESRLMRADTTNYISRMNFHITLWTFCVIILSLTTTPTIAKKSTTNYHERSRKDLQREFLVKLLAEERSNDVGPFFIKAESTVRHKEIIRMTTYQLKMPCHQQSSQETNRFYSFYDERADKTFLRRRRSSSSKQLSSPLVLSRFRGGNTSSADTAKLVDDNIASTTIPRTSNIKNKIKKYSPLQMYFTILIIVSIWITTGTLFYSFVNSWPIPQSFFYAVDAGMSIGFCTDVAETKLISKAFTILYILLGASVVGGALVLFIEDAVEGIADNKYQTREYQLLLEKEVFDKYNVSRSGALSLEEFKQVLNASTNQPLSEEDIQMLWSKFDKLKDGVIHFEEFAGTYRGIDELIASLRNDNASKKQSFHFLTTMKTLWNHQNRIYFCFLGWVLLGVIWGMLDQGWDPVTATHFAISALATGGLTAPPVNSEGILPAEPAIFCGFYCLLGIPLMAVTLGHFARALVSNHVAAMEEQALTRPMTATDYEVAKQYLTSKPSQNRSSTKKISDGDGSGLHLSDFVVLQLLRQGKLSVETLNVLKKEFELLDKDETGLLTLQEATTWKQGGSHGEKLKLIPK